MKIIANLISGKVSSNSSSAFNLLSERQIGQRVSEKIIYSFFEALYLIKNEKMVLYDKNKKIIDKNVAEAKFEKIDKDFKTKYIVFNDLVKKGFILKSALKFGADFRIYEKGKKIGKEHSKWLLFITLDKNKISWKEFVSKNRIAHSTKKDLLIAVVDDEESITYFKTNWTKL